MSVLKILQSTTPKTNPYKRQRDISNEIKEIRRQTDYIKKYDKDPPPKLTYSEKDNKYFLKKLNII